MDYSHVKKGYEENHLPIFIIPHKDVIVYSEPGSTDLWKNSHHTVALHICYSVKVKNKTKHQ